MDKQRDFEKGWEEYEAKRKQEITEIASDLSKAVIQDYGGVYFLETAEKFLERLKEPPYKDFTEAWVADEIAKEFTGGKE